MREKDYKVITLILDDLGDLLQWLQGHKNEYIQVLLGSISFKVTIP